MSDDTLSQAVDAFLRKRVLPNGKRKYNQAHEFFRQTKTSTRLTYGLLQQDSIVEWLDQPLIGPQSYALAEALHKAIDDSIARYTRQKQPLFDLYKSFCEFLTESYGFQTRIDWNAYTILSSNREWQIIQMSTENKTIQEMAGRLMVSDRQIREDMNQLADHGLTFLDRKVKISGLVRSHGGIQFESTPHPILILGSLMQVISLLESLRHYQQISQSEFPFVTAQQIWFNLSLYARTTIKKRIREGVYQSDIGWYDDLDRKMKDRGQEVFLTEAAIAARNAQDQIIKCFKNSEVCTMRYQDEKDALQILDSIRIRNLQRDFVQLENLRTGQLITLETWQVISCETQKS